ncbi:DHH family phosphoesterase [Halococcoides cellulosivorans]|uniref:RecJ like exonuclease n=1 Tax=Halococcoides cellulosivorans TaxID=1679096 RepID=A0A2R4WYU5_9EURY|nr:OB-fold nucleic acid binding domain-containing protein [Halococcoides cellulosivorans]AWB26717.1 RecJ like exonuclease [Halococcoides cellulosivorans]
MTPGNREVVYDLDPRCREEALEEGALYHATVNGVVPYGVFVDVSEHVSGLVHESNLLGEYGVGDKVIVALDEIKADGDLSFVERRPGEYTTEAVDRSDGPAIEALPDAVGETVTLSGELAQINQTGGPTIFTLRDGTGLIPCAAFEAAGVRAYPDVSIEDPVRITGQLEARDGGLQIEVDDLEALSGSEAEDCHDRVASAIEERSAPESVDPLIDWPAMEPLLEDLDGVARRLRRAALEGRPIRIRHHADGDGICAAVPLEHALEQYLDAVHLGGDPARHRLQRLPAKAPYYELEDVTRDLNYALGASERHGQQLPLLVMLDNGSTAEDVPAYRNLAHYDIPIVVIDHHHPDPDAVADLLDAHVNPYLHDEDYRITTGMLAVELARSIAPALTGAFEHVPAVAGLADRSEADAMDDYLALAEDGGYAVEDLQRIGEALDYATHWLRYDDGGQIVRDALDVDCPDDERHADLVRFLSDRARRDVQRQVDAAEPHLDREDLANGARCVQLDLDEFAHRFTYPAPGKTTGAIHDREVADAEGPVITIGYGPDFAVLRSDGVRLDIPEMVTALQAETDGGVSGGGHLVVGSIRFVEGRREAVLSALIDKMADADIDEALSSSAVLPDAE